MEGLPSWAAQYVGLPYKTNGRDRSGIDCWGLLSLVSREQFGIELPAYTGTGWFIGQDPKLVAADAIDHARCFPEVPRGLEKTGDGIMIRLRGVPLHVALVLVPGVMLHTHEAADSCVESYRSMNWTRRILGFYRLSERR